MTSKELRSLFRSSLASAKDRHLIDCERALSACVAARLLPIMNLGERGMTMVAETIAQSLDSEQVVLTLARAVNDEECDEERARRVFLHLAERAFREHYGVALVVLVYWAHARGQVVPDEIVLEGERVCVEHFHVTTLRSYRRVWEALKRANPTTPFDAADGNAASAVKLPDRCLVDPT